jgi:hypothetical protein
MPGQNKTLEDLFLETLKDMYYAERKILVALPKWQRPRILTSCAGRDGRESPASAAGFQDDEAGSQGQNLPGCPRA